MFGLRDTQRRLGALMENLYGYRNSDLKALLKFLSNAAKPWRKRSNKKKLQRPSYNGVFADQMRLSAGRAVIVFIVVFIVLHCKREWCTRCAVQQSGDIRIDVYKIHECLANHIKHSIKVMANWEIVKSSSALWSLAQSLDRMTIRGESAEFNILHRRLVSAGKGLAMEITHTAQQY